MKGNHGSSSHYALIALISLESLLLAPSAYAKILKCNADYKSTNGWHLEYAVTIVVAENHENYLWALDAENLNRTEVLSLEPVGISLVEWSFRQYGSKVEHDMGRHVFVQTRQPGGAHSLIGFFMYGPYPVTLRADLWAEGKPFYIYRSDVDQEIVGIGACE